ncbi:hypothetical protein [Salinithrix halophila]|uniref:Uncharacterized protein n=1 Tax=Salinithrix halophila TaxID=1485204 RepID=A0ABV8JF50_9BACL
MNIRKIGATVLGGAILFTLTASPTLAAKPVTAQKGYEVVAQKKVDVTGDGKEDVVKLMGHKFEDSKVYYDKFYLSVTDVAKKKTMKKTVKADGYEPTLSFKKYNKDNIKDIHVRVSSGATGHSPVVDLYYTAKNGKISLAKKANKAHKGYKVVAQKKVDVTGDGKEDVVKLMGHNYEGSKVYYDKFYLSVTDVAKKKTMKKTVKADGYEPTLYFKKFTNDNVKDIRVSVFSGATGHSPVKWIHYTAVNGKIEKL